MMAALAAAVASAPVHAGQIMYGHSTLQHCVLTIWGGWCPVESIGYSALFSLIIAAVFVGLAWLARRLGAASRRRT